MLFGNADVEGPLRKRLLDLVEASARGHRRRDRHNLVVARHLGLQRVGEDAGVARRPAARPLVLLSADDVELDDAVIFVGAVLGRSVALALLGHGMNQDRAVLRVADIFQHFDQSDHVMAVDRADVVEAQLFEQRTAGDEAARIFLHPARGAAHGIGQRAGDLLRHASRAKILVRADQPGERVAQAANRRRDRHVVVVEDDDQPIADAFGVIHRLIGHAGRHRAVADHRNRALILAGQLARHGEADRGGNTGRAVGGAKRVVFALGALGEAADTPALADGAHPVAATGHDLVRIGLVADVPDQFVVGRVENIVDGHGQFDHAKPRAEMAAGHRDGGDHLFANLVRQLLELALVELANVCRVLDLVEQRSHGTISHSLPP